MYFKPWQWSLGGVAQDCTLLEDIDKLRNLPLLSLAFFTREFAQDRKPLLLWVPQEAVGSHDIPGAWLDCTQRGL